ncbi:hypothetical protein LZG72_20370 [Dyadobacter sp. CY323]|nr:hypothetical protein [Dyadobacter sp. CY323]
MTRGDRSMKRARLQTAKSGVRRFLERGFDWIALVLITLIILLTLIFF